MTIVPHVHQIVMEASSKEDRSYMKNMDKHDIHQINGQLVQNLYRVISNRKGIDFGDIPDSKGDIERVKYYENTIQSLDVLEELFRKNNIMEPGIEVVRKSIGFMKLYKPHFCNGFKYKHDFIMIMYNSLVMAIIDATCVMISSYMEFIISSEPDYTLNHVITKQRSSVSFENLKSFNTVCENGNMGQIMSYMIKEQKNALMGADVVVTGVIVFGLLSIVPLIRELIYFYYKSRVKVSEYLELQSQFLEMNKLAVESSNRSPKERKEIAKKQDAIITKMRKMADKIQINNVDTFDVVKKEIKDENSLWSLNTIEKQINKSKMGGGGLSIL